MAWFNLYFVIFCWQYGSETAFTDDCMNISTPVDIVFMVDGTWSFDRQQLSVLSNVLENLPTHTVNFIHNTIGLIIYQNKWNFTKFYSTEDVIKTFAMMPNREGSPYTGRGLSFALETILKKEHGFRTGVPKIMILVSSCESKDDVTVPAQNLRDSGVELYAIGAFEKQFIANFRDHLRAGVSVDSMSRSYGVSVDSILFQLAVCTEDIKPQEDFKQMVTLFRWNYFCEIRNISEVQQLKAIASRPVDKYIFIPTKFDIQLVLQLMQSACKRILQLVRKTQDSIGKHTLLYTYTALLREDGLEVTGIGRLDDQTIEVYNCKNQTWVPKTEWMKNNMPSGYWQRGILTAKDKKSTILGILQGICAYKKSADCVVQWRVGCEAEKLANDTLIIGKQVKEYHMNGEFTQMFNGAENLSNYVSDFPLKKCVDQMKKFIIYNDREPSSPEVIAFSTKKNQACLRLTCMASGFYPRDMEMSLQMNGVLVTEEDGVRSTGTVPNGDGTFQLRKSLEIVDCMLPYDVLYVCVVKHTGTKTIKSLPIIKLDGMCGYVLRIRDGIILVSLLLLLLSHAVFCCVMKRKAGSPVI